MASKKEVVAVSLLAIGLAAVIGTISYGLFAAAPPEVKLENVLDVYTAKGGVGANISDGTFGPFDNASVYAYLTQGGAAVRDNSVTFTITRPDGTTTVKIAVTDDSGVAHTSISFLPAEDHVIGTWRILANTTIGNEVVDDKLTLQCISQNARIDIFLKRNGVASLSFLPSDQVLLEATLSYGNASIAGTPVTFEIESPNGTEFKLQPVSTDSLGTSEATFPIPLSSDFSLGTWKATVTSEVYGQALNATLSFECMLLPPVIDVYTQKGGYGPNMAGGVFTLNETVSVYAQIRDELNRTVPGALVGFQIQKFQPDSGNESIIYRANQTDASGIASIRYAIYPDPANAGTYSVYVSSRYQETVILDTLTFVVQQQ